MPEPFLNLALSLPKLGTTLLTIFGIGLVIFVHELGHFLAAKKVGVRVEVFSLGFGPRLFGFRRGPTDYRVSVVPIGGYVKMAGDIPGDGTGESDELLTRSVGERFLIYSGGVVMNVVFAVVAFPIIFAFGVPMVKPAVGGVAPGGPAWKAGLLEGDVIREVNGREILGFADVVLEVALCDPDATTMLIERNGEERLVAISPEYSETRGSFAIQVSQPTDYRVIVTPGGPAEKAGLKSGDRIVTLNGEPVSERLIALQDLSRPDPVRVGVEREAEGVLELTLSPEMKENPDRLLIGIRALENRVRALRGVLLDPGSPLSEGDLLLSLGGQPVLGADNLAHLLSGMSPGESADLVLDRAGRNSTVRLEPRFLSALAEDVALELHEQSGGGGVPVRVSDDSPAFRAGLRTGDLVTRIDGEPTPTWTDLRTRISAADGQPIRLSIRQDGQQRDLVLAAEPQITAYLGFDLETASVERRYGWSKAFVVGMRSSWNFTRQAYLMLRQMVARQVSAENLGGIVAISQVSYRFAERGLAKLFHFLALLSINLAVINLLPIPVLDGGHLAFLLVEKIKGSPVNDRVMGYSQVFGLMIILSLLIFVTYNDIQRILVN